MLRSYAAIYTRGHLEWLDDVPDQDNKRVIVTFVDDLPQNSSLDAEAILKQAWGCVEQPRTIEQIDQDIAQMRNEWE
jgi:hypothetical protein